MLKGHLPRVVYHSVYFSIRRLTQPNLVYECFTTSSMAESYNDFRGPKVNHHHFAEINLAMAVLDGEFRPIDNRDQEVEPLHNFKRFEDFCQKNGSEQGQDPALTVLCVTTSYANTCNL